MAALLMKNIKVSSANLARLYCRKIRCGRDLSSTECRLFSQVFITHQCKRRSSTAAHKFETHDTPLVKTSNILKVIDEAFLKIDLDVRSTGRISSKDVVAVFNELKSAGAMSSTHSLYLIRCCERLHDDLPSKKGLLVNEIWKTLQDSGTPMTSDHYNALLKVYLQYGHTFSPIEFLSEMESKGVQPNRITYQLLIDKFCSDGKLTGASTILEYMKEKELSINDAVFHSLIKGHAKLSDFDGAKNLLEVMKKSHLQPSSETYTILACGYAEAGKIQDMKETLMNARRNGLLIPNNSYFRLISALAAGGQKEHINEMINKMEFMNEYKEECINAVMDLINRSCSDVAYKLILMLTDSNFRYGAQLFINHLIKTEKPIQEIVSYCHDIYTVGSNNYVYFNAVRTSLEFGRIDCALEVFQEMQKKGIPVRNSHYWPVFKLLKEKNDSDGVWSALKSMHDLGLPVDFDTYINKVFPVIHTMNPSSILTKIEISGHSVVSVIDPLFEYYCKTSQINHAASLIEKYPVRVRNGFCLQKFVSFYNSCQENPRMFLQILKYIMENTDRNLEKARESFYGHFLIQLIRLNIPLFGDFLRMLNAEAFKFSDGDIATAQPVLIEKAPDLIVLLRAMKSSEHSVSRKTEYHSINDEEIYVEKLEHYITDLKKHNAPIRSALLELLRLHIKRKNVVRVSEIKKELDNQDFKFSHAIYAQLISLFAESCDIEEAQTLKNALMEHYPEFRLDTVKTLEYVTMLVKHSKFDEAVLVIEREYDDSHYNGRVDVLIRSHQKLLNAASETGNVSLVKNLYSAIVSSHLKAGVPNTILLEYLVKVHLIRNDLHGAIEEFKGCIRNHHVSPCMVLLLRKCIYAQDPEKLQQVVDLTSACEGKSSALHELAGVFIELGHVLKAGKILQSLGQKADINYLDDICCQLFKHNKDVELKQFIQLTRDLWHIDRDRLYYHLLELYAERNNYKEALEVWTLYQQENVQPSARTLKLLSDLLTKNKQPLPFEETLAENCLPRTVDTVNSGDCVVKFLKCLDSGDAFQAIRILENMKKGHIRSIPYEYMSKLIDSLVQKKSIRDLSLIAQAMHYIIENAHDIVKPVVEKYSTAGDLNAMNLLQKFLPDFVQKKVLFNYFFSKACIVSGRHEDLLLELEKLCGKKNKLFSVYGFQELLKKPELEERIMKLADRYLKEIKFDLPLAVVWAHYFQNENYCKADELHQISKINPASIAKVDSYIIRTFISGANVTMGRKFIDFLNHHNMKQRQKERAYTAQLDVLVSKEMYDEASALIEECETQNVSLSRLRRATLISLQSALERENKIVSFSIPPEEIGSDSSSDSD